MNPLPEYLSRDRALHPPALHPEYRSSVTRSPREPLVPLRQTLSEITGPGLPVADGESDLLANAGTGQAPVGERILVHGRVLDQFDRPLPGVGVEIWQANAAGRYRHDADRGIAPLDPNFAGTGRCRADREGRYAFLTVRPGAYPWPNGENTWRPAHIHFSLFGPGFASRLVTQMYFEGDPLIPLDPIANSVPGPDGPRRLTAALDLDAATPFDRLAWRFDIVLRGRRATPLGEEPA